MNCWNDELLKQWKNYALFWWSDELINWWSGEKTKIWRNYTLMNYTGWSADTQTPLHTHTHTRHLIRISEIIQYRANPCSSCPNFSRLRVVEPASACWRIDNEGCSIHHHRLLIDERRCVAHTTQTRSDTPPIRFAVWHGPIKAPHIWYKRRGFAHLWVFHLFPCSGNCRGKQTLHSNHYVSRVCLYEIRARLFSVRCYTFHAFSSASSNTINNIMSKHICLSRFFLSLHLCRFFSVQFSSLFHHLFLPVIFEAHAFIVCTFHCVNVQVIKVIIIIFMVCSIFLSRSSNVRSHQRWRSDGDYHFQAIVNCLHQ